MDRSSHAQQRIEEEAERQKTLLKSIVEKQRRNLEDKKAVARQLKEDYAERVQQGKDVKRDVEKFVDDLNAAVEAKKKIIFAAVENQTKKSLDILTERKTDIEQQIKAMESSLEKADEILRSNANVGFIRLKKSLKTIFEGTNQTGQNDRREANVLPPLAFVKNQKLLDTVKTEALGSLEISHPTIASRSLAEGKGLKEVLAGSEAEFDVITRDAEGRQCYNNVDRVTVEMCAEQGEKCTTKVQITDNKDGSYKISYSPLDQGIHKVTVKVNGEHICDSPFSVQVKPFRLRPVLSFGKRGLSVGMFKNPWGVAVNETDAIAVTDYFNHNVQIFNSDGNHVRSFGQNGDEAGEFDYPTGIAFHKNGNIFVADNNNNRIQIFSGEGEYVGQFGEKGNQDCRLNSPRGLSIDSNGNIIVADSDNKAIKIFSPNGEFLLKTGGKEFYPWHCIQFDSYLLASDSAGHCIRVFDREGNFQYKFGKLGSGNGELNHPRCLSVNQSGQLYVCDEGNHRIQMFEINGQFVGKFGTLGKKWGEFQKARSVAVLSNGRIAVCDSINNRIQVFEELNVLQLQTE